MHGAAGGDVASVVNSLGRVGNRIYTDLSADEMYSVIPGARLATIAEHLATIASANAARVALIPDP